jgi:translation initiation factor 3 subunit B
MYLRYSNIPDEWVPPEPQEYKDQGNLHSYLLDPDAYDQYCVVCGGGNLVQIWQNSQPEPNVVEDRPVRFISYYKFC